VLGGAARLLAGEIHPLHDRPEQFRPAPEQQLNDPGDVARTVLFALRQPPGCELRELIVTPSTEPSWP
jgi:NADP-dependent 3-hydroxy acid dehydrogenase YdfG